ncbi:MAG TPA: exosome complex protein Rrp42 [Candidatus Nanoarchaeia archaeon]|nr:exosome complex protein Rrp42 [Candidatus Nanoarchaeia archaeon]
MTNHQLREHICNALTKGFRLDGRKMDEFRPLTIKTDCIRTAEGSAWVRCGETELLVGIKLALEKPFPDTPDEGVLMVGAELLPLANPAFESGPPGIESIETARVIDRGIRESHAIDTHQLCVEKGVKVWTVSVDICPLNHDGNLIDLGGMAAIAALKNAKFPMVKDGVIDYQEHQDKKLPIVETPIPVTVIKIGDNLLVDPTEDEESVLDARLTMAFLENGNICAMQKGGDEPITSEEFEKMLELGSRISKELRQKIR